MHLKVLLPVLLTLLAQRLLGMPGLPPWTAEIILPAVWLVVAAFSRKERSWPYEALALGLAWDVLFEPVIGPGGIAWSASCLFLYAIAGVVADRTPKAWIGFGIVGVSIVLIVQKLVLLPLGFELSFSFAHWTRSIVLTGAWCGLVGVVLALDIPGQWRTYRARKLR
jgi:hypothetical protein